MTVRILYFAWLRERLGRSEEELALPEGVARVSDLLDWLRDREPVLREAGKAVRVAVNQCFAAAADPVAAGDEIALFPPVTGG
jgi:sulfur-carrier protein